MVKTPLAEAVADHDVAPGVRGHILVIDDDEIFAATAARILREAGFEVKVAASFQAALEALDGPGALDLMVADLVMPRQVNGIALSRMARLRRKGLKVIYVTGYDIPAGADEQAAGPILRKPVSDDQLVREVQRVLAAH